MTTGGNGRFITLEGGEGSGKSTQARLLADFLAGPVGEVVLTREPGGAPGAEQIRALLVDGDVHRWDATTEALLHFAARRDHLVNTVWPALARGAWVISDRFADSTMAYQGYGHGLDREVVAGLYRLCVGPLKPDLTLILDLPAEAGLARAAGRQGGEDRYERMDGEFHRRLRDGFLEIARREPERCVVIDASRDADSVQAAIADAVRGRLLASVTP
jgi:dTMP kinase